VPNFYADNPDIRFHLAHLDLEPLVRLRERDFAEASEYDYAPEDVADALDNYRRTLDLVGEVAGEMIAPLSAEIDEEGSHLCPEDGRVRYAAGLRKALDALGRADLMGATLPRRFGGLNLPGLIYTMATEIVSRADASLMNIFGLQGIAETINMFASQDQKQAYLPRFASGEVTGAMVLTEPEAGSDLQNVQLKAYQDDGGAWRLSGVKRCWSWPAASRTRRAAWGSACFWPSGGRASASAGPKIRWASAGRRRVRSSSTTPRRNWWANGVAAWSRT